MKIIDEKETEKKNTETRGREPIGKRWEINGFAEHLS